MKRMTIPFLVGVGLAVSGTVRADGAPNPLHPTFRVLDAAGESVLVTGAPASSDKTCGSCHDAVFINEHNFHVKSGRAASCVECHVEGSRLPTAAEAFDDQGFLKREAIRISAPRDANCAFCHGIVHSGASPLTIPEDFEAIAHSASGRRTYALTRNTGEILSPQSMSDSFLNLQGKETRTRPWDVHSQRLVGCTACHFARNNPAKAYLKHTTLDFLVRDPRTVSMAEFLHRPDHELVTATCQSCHDPLATHGFLPYRKRHLDTLDCRSCHVPFLAGPAAQSIDATVVTDRATPRVEYRGLQRRDGEPLDTAFSRGYAPFLVRRVDPTSGAKIAPINLVTRWSWVSKATGEEVPWDRVVAAWRDGDRVPAEVLATLDANGDGRLEDSELVLDTPNRVEVIRRRLVALGIADPVIQAVIEPHPIAHGVVSGAWVRRQCDSCHSERSGLDRDIPLSASVPGGVIPPPLVGGSLDLDGTVQRDAANGLVLQHVASPALYVFGHSRGAWVDRIGVLGLAAMVIGIGVHAGLRIRARRRHVAHHAPVRKEYLYSAYERLWHWLMAISILILMVTGFEIHFAGDASCLGLPLAVALHNVFAVILTINAFLSLFYHLASGAIRQFLPPKENLVDQVAAQARYYLRGIFLGQPHPTSKSLERKLNPLQQLTYLALLNVLFPFQVVTGILLWSASHWLDFADSIGGLTVVSPLHSLGSWMFLWFVVLHVYLTTTGHTVFSNISAMVSGWDEVEVNEAPAGGGSNV